MKRERRISILRKQEGQILSYLLSMKQTQQNSKRNKETDSKTLNETEKQKLQDSEQRDHEENTGKQPWKVNIASTEVS